MPLRRGSPGSGSPGMGMDARRATIFPRPRFLKTVEDPQPSPQPSFARWAGDWDLWGDLSDGGWSRLTLWERWLAHLFLPEDSDSLPATRVRWAASGDPLSKEEAAWFLAGPPRSAPDPLSRFKLRALQVFPSRLQQVAVRFAEVSLARGVAGPSLTTCLLYTSPRPRARG